MIKKRMKRKDLVSLKAAIKGFGKENRILRKKRKKLLEQKKWTHSYWIEAQRKELSSLSRIHLLAYGFLLGKSYNKIERNCPLKTDGIKNNKTFLEIRNKKFVKKIIEVCELHTPVWITFKEDEQTILDWLNAEKETCQEKENLP